MEPEKTEEDIKRIELTKVFLEKERKRHQEMKPDKYYDKVTEEQKKALLEQYNKDWRNKI